MDVKVYSYINPAYAAPAVDIQTEPADSGEDSFSTALSAAQKAVALDAAIAEAKQTGEIGVSVYSSKARELGVSKTFSAKASGTSFENTPVYAASYSSSSSARNYVNDLACTDELNSYFDEAAKRYNVDVKLLKSIAKAESGFRADAVSSAGAVGIMQLMPQTAAGLGVDDSYNAYKNIMGGASYISQLLGKYNGNVSLALAAYNAGSANVEKYNGIPPFEETQNYVAKVLSYYTN